MTLPLLLACEIEGDDPGECTDGADNDADGYFDCEDDLCRNSPDCDGTSEGDADADSDADTDTDTDADTDIPAYYDGSFGGLSVDYQLDWHYEQGGVGLEDCLEVYAGSADKQVAASGYSVTFEGSWSEISNDCNTGGAVWKGGALVYHTLIFKDTDGQVLDAWLVHSAKGSGTDSDNNGIDDAWEASGDSWWLTQMNTAVDGGSVSYQTQDYIPDYFLQLNHDLDLTLQ